MDTVVTGLLFVTFFFITFFYIALLAKMRSVEQKVKKGNDSSGSTKYHSTVRIMMLFVAVFVLQWWASLAFSVWNIFSQPSVVIYWGAIFFSNLGGLFNGMAYTLLRRKQSQGGMKAEVVVHPTAATTAVTVTK